jgi:hypothetical protein
LVLSKKTNDPSTEANEIRVVLVLCSVKQMRNEKKEPFIANASRQLLKLEKKLQSTFGRNSTLGMSHVSL